MNAQCEQPLCSYSINDKNDNHNHMNCINGNRSYSYIRGLVLKFFIFLISGVYFGFLISNYTDILILEWILEV
jgi:hypothetical protein